MNISRVLLLVLVLSACHTTAQSPVLKSEAVSAENEVEFAKRILLDSIEYPTVEGRGKVPELATYYANVFEQAGFAKSDIKITPFEDNAILEVTLRGREAGAPTLLIGHMDVVEADPADWTRDPFTAIEEGGYIFGRGATDNKFGLAMQVTTMAKLKRNGYVPKNDIILVLSGDEETTQRSTQMLAKKYKGAALVLNSDAGGGTLSEDGHARYYSLQAAEKSYSDFTLEFTNPGGHSSWPTKPNAIAQLAHALVRLDAHQFEPQRSEITKAALLGIAGQVDATLGDAMRRFVRDPDDSDAVEVIRSSPEHIGQIGTTCVSTMVEAGHAVNALPQRATANINCRIFPGISVQEVKTELERVIDDPAAVLEIAWEPTENRASPLRDDVVKAITKAVHTAHPGLPIIPSMSAGTTDSVFFRAQGVDSYGVSGLFMRPSDQFAHGLNERVPVAAIAGALAHWESIVLALTK